MAVIKIVVLAVLCIQSVLTKSDAYKDRNKISDDEQGLHQQTHIIKSHNTKLHHHFNHHPSHHLNHHHHHHQNHNHHVRHESNRHVHQATGHDANYKYNLDSSVPHHDHHVALFSSQSLINSKNEESRKHKTQQEHHHQKHNAHEQHNHDHINNDLNKEEDDYEEYDDDDEEDEMMTIPSTTTTAPSISTTTLSTEDILLRAYLAYSDESYLTQRHHRSSHILPKQNNANVPTIKTKSLKTSQPDDDYDSEYDDNEDGGNQHGAAVSGSVINDSINELRRIQNHRTTIRSTSTKSPPPSSLGNDYPAAEPLPIPSPFTGLHTPSNHHKNVHTDEDVLRTYNQGSPDSFTNEKFKLLGTRENVIQAREEFNQIEDSNKYREEKWRRHMILMATEGTCKYPKPTVVYPPRPTLAHVQYMPRATLIHRCSGDTGCCRDIGQVCTSVDNKTTIVELQFKLMEVLKNGHPKYEFIKLSFHNHTECHCVSMPSYTPVATRVVDNTQCPLSFIKVKSGVDDYECDCVDGHTMCIQLKNGEEHFSMDSRKCILNRTCHRPNCEYGSYNFTTGSCPRKRDLFPD